MNCITFFAGAGGLDMGMHNAGFDIRMSLELENTYCNTLRANHPQWNVVNRDIMHITDDEIRDCIPLGEELDVMVGGSPCQSFSTAGNRGSFNDPRGQAMLRYAELVTIHRPKVFVLENVVGLLSASLRHRPLNQRGGENLPLDNDEQAGSAFNYLMERFEGYRVECHVVNAADYGVPQKRKRVFIIGIRNDIPNQYIFPNPTHNENGDNGLQPWVTFNSVINELNNIGVEHEFARYTPNRMRFMELIPQGGGNWRDLPLELQEEALGGAYNSTGGRVGFYRRIRIDSPAPTLLTSPNQKSTILGHPIEDRPLSIQEYLMIQGFPVDYYLEGTITKKYIQIGNAVPVRLAEIIGESILGFLNNI